MANDVYLQIDGIKGESNDDKHKDWIEVSNVLAGIHQPGAEAVSTAGGQTSGKADLSNITFTKLADMSSPILKQHCAMSKTIPKAKFEFVRADGNGNPITYYKIELENVTISGVSMHSGDGGIVRETLHLAYSRLKWTYTRQDSKGGSIGSTSGGWDAAANKVAS